MQTWAGGSTGKAENALTKGPIDNVDYNITLMWVIQDQEPSAGVPTPVSTPMMFVVTVGSMQELAVVVALVVSINVAENFGSLLFCYILFFRLRHNNWSSSELTMQGCVLHSPSDKIRITSILVECQCMLLAQCIACRTGNRVQREIKTREKKIGACA